MMANMNNFHGLGAPGAGFASRGKTNRPSRLSLASPPRVDSISENPADGLPQPPRTSRSHLLAGLRTQPKTPGPVPASAPYNKTSHGMQNYQLSNQYQQQQVSHGYGNVPHTAIGSNFPLQQQQYYNQAGQQHYALPEQEIDHQEQIDAQTLEKLAIQEQRLALQAQYLQYQMAALNMGGQNVLYPQTPATPQQMPLFNQQQLQSQGIVTQEIPGQPGVYLATNLLTGQSQLLYDPSIQQAELSNSPPPPTPGRLNTKFAAEQPRDTGSPYSARSRSPPKKAASPAVDVQPLPPPSANAFRRNHNRNRSSLVLNSANGAQVGEGPKSAIPRTVGLPGTPMTGTFGPGHGRAGEHPIRQPMGPPSIDELKKAPTTKCEGSKNFVARTRRNALSTLVKAGRERRTVRPGSGNGSGSAGSLTPVSDAEITFSVPSDNDSDSGRSLSGRRSFGSIRAVASGAIGSERKLRKSSQESIGGSRSGTPVEEKAKRFNLLQGLGTQA